MLPNQKYEVVLFRNYCKLMFIFLSSVFSHVKELTWISQKPLMSSETSVMLLKYGFIFVIPVEEEKKEIVDFPTSVVVDAE